MTKPKRYPDNWQEIALSVKESALWRCTKCNQQCLRPGKKSGLTKSERCSLTLTVHHRNRIPEDNRPENLIALCTACHLSYHNRGQSNVSPGQLSLFPDDDIDWNIMGWFCGIGTRRFIRSQSASISLTSSKAVMQSSEYNKLNRTLLPTPQNF